MGSPPHMRGKDDRSERRSPAPGITPAHAGKSKSVTQAPHSYWDHPRTCGEKAFCTACRSFSVGSPPHMRGKITQKDECGYYLGITPAHAGKRKTVLWVRPSRRDHPRTCGEKCNTIANDIYQQGSPPHMRGKGIRDQLEAEETGITPAHAGKRLRKP